MIILEIYIKSILKIDVMEDNLIPLSGFKNNLNG